MADAAVLSVIFTGTVGVLGAATAATGHWVALKTEQRRQTEARREDLRTVLDTAAAASMTVLEYPIGKETSFREIAGALTHGRTELSTHLSRIGVRIGPASEAYREFERIEANVGKLELVLLELPPDLTLADIDADENPPLDTAPFVAYRESTHWNDAKSAQTAFLTAANELVGAFVKK